MVPIVGKFITSGSQLRAYVDGLDLSAWKPEFVVLHNTGVPDLGQRPMGFTHEHMENLASYYGDTMHWHAGPHFFVDQNGVWVFSDPTRPGVHSPSWNEISWGVEMLGDYDHDVFTVGQGAKVAANAIFLLAALHHRAGLDSHTLRLHREDPLTSHRDCPGQSVVKGSVIARVHNMIAAWEAV